MSNVSHNIGAGANHGRRVHLPLQPSEAALAIVADALGRIRFGDIRLTVHEGRLVQIDVTEKIRLPQN